MNESYTQQCRCRSHVKTSPLCLACPAVRYKLCVVILNSRTCYTFVKIGICLKLIMIVICCSYGSDYGGNCDAMILPNIYQCVRGTCFLHHPIIHPDDIGSRTF
jgi:hypothetical protein